MKARLTEQSLTKDGQYGFNKVMRELSQLIVQGVEENRFTIIELGRDGSSTALRHPYFTNKDADGRRSSRGEEQWWYQPAQWEINDLEGEAVEL